MPYEVSTPVFEGPFDLLLHLILKEEVDLWEISLARIVDAFCAEVERMQRVDLESATEFLLIAATLVELKARRLLPGRDDIELDEELSPLRGARPPARPAPRLQDVPGRGEGAATRGSPTRAARSPAARARRSRSARSRPIRWSGSRSTRSSPRPAPGCSRRPPPEVRTDHVAPIRASVRDAVETILALLPATGAVRFRDLTLGAAREARGHRALPRGARAVQAGRDRSRAGGELRRSHRAAARARRARRARPPVDRRPRRRADVRRSPTSPTTTESRTHASRNTHERPTLRSTWRRAARSRRWCSRRPSRCRRRCSRSSSSCRPTRVEELCDELAAEYEREGRGFQLARVAGGYRFQTHPDAYAYVERFVLEGPDRALVGPGARDAGDHRVQAADRPRADLGDPRRERRRDAEDARRPRLRRGERARAHARQSHAVLDHARVPRAARRRLARRSSRRSPTSFPSRASSRRSSGACAASTSSSTARATTAES